MKNSQSIFLRENSLILRGVAILFIVMHNFLHLTMFGFTEENEMSFSLDKAEGFIGAISNGSNVFAEFISHLGWIAVPVFVFLTGYGIALSTPPQGHKAFSFVKKKYLKLLILMLPAVLFFALADVLRGDIWPDLLKRASYLTMLVNFIYPYANCLPGVYWYFGFTFQFYLLWALFGKFFNWKNLVGLSVVSLIGLYMLCAFDLPDGLSIYRHCFTGWFPVFAIGICMGKRKNEDFFAKCPLWGEILSIVLLLGVILLMSLSLISWLFIPIVALLWFFFLGKLLLRTRYISAIFRWIGSYSACLFVCHPIARSIVLNVAKPNAQTWAAYLAIYLILSILIAVAYNYLYKWLLSRILPQGK